MFRLNNSNFKGRKDINIFSVFTMLNSFLLSKIASMKISFYILIISVLIWSCNTKDNYIQEVYVNEYVDLSLASNSDINTPGNAIFVNGGIEGIIIYYGGGNDYKVYDRNCSYEPSLSCSVIDSVNSGIAYCGCCPSFFLISDNGRSLYGPALLPLKSYHWSLDNNIIRIFN